MSIFKIASKDDVSKAVWWLENAVDYTEPKMLVIKDWKKDRTLAQNRLMWLWLETIALSLQCNKEDLHDELKARINGVKEVEYTCQLTGETRIAHVPKSTTKLTVQGMTDYLNAVDAFALELDVLLPRPPDLYEMAYGKVE